MKTMYKCEVCGMVFDTDTSCRLHESRHYMSLDEAYSVISQMDLNEVTDDVFSCLRCPRGMKSCDGCLIRARNAILDEIDKLTGVKRKRYPENEDFAGSKDNGN